MTKNKVLKGVIIVVSIMVIVLLLHLTMNYFVPFVSEIHNKSGVY